MLSLPRGSLWAEAYGGKCGLDFLEHAELESQHWEEGSFWQLRNTPVPQYNWVLWRKGVSRSLHIPILLGPQSRGASCCSDRRVRHPRELWLCDLCVSVTLDKSHILTELWFLPSLEWGL